MVDVTINNMKSGSHYPHVPCPAEATFGFNPTYSVSEDVGNITVAVSLLSGILDRDLIVSLLTLNGTAVGESDKGHLHVQDLQSCCKGLTIMLCNLIPQSSWDGLSRHIH